MTGILVMDQPIAELEHHVLKSGDASPIRTPEILKVQDPIFKDDLPVPGSYNTPSSLPELNMAEDLYDDQDNNNYTLRRTDDQDACRNIQAVEDPRGPEQSLSIPKPDTIASSAEQRAVVALLFSDADILTANSTQAIAAEPEAATVLDEEIKTPANEEKADNGETDTLDIDDFIEELPKRTLRPQSNIKRAFPTTWMDTDPTENYDPIEDERQQRAKRQRVVSKPRRNPSEHEDSSEHEVRPPVEKPKLIVSLRFKADDSKRRFSSLVTQSEATGQAETAGYKLRTRAKETERLHDCRTEDHIKSHHTELDLRAKPYARGCWGCVHLSGKESAQTCSLLHDENKWPCQVCEEDGHDCQLIIPPVQKRACEFCKTRKVQCSYKTTRNHEGPCKQCADVGYNCIAGPVKDSIRQRIRYDRDWELDPLPKKKGKAPAPRDCLECRQIGESCTYLDSGEGPCIDCKWAKLPCTIDTGEEVSAASLDIFDFTSFLSQSKPPKPIATDPQAATTKKADSQPTQNPNPPTSKPKPPPPSSKSNPNSKQPPKGHLITISTNFSHPIIFNCDQQTSTTSCHFCTSPSLAFIGFGLKENVEVILWTNNQPLTETKNGHQASGISSTSLCTDCTTSRLSILLCQRHQMRPVDGVDTTFQAKEKAEEALFERNEDWGVWCQLCCGLASYECVASEECGLRLCEICAVTLEGRCEGDLKGLVGMIERGEVREPEEGWRADVELLGGEGEVMRHLRRMCM